MHDRQGVNQIYQNQVFGQNKSFFDKTEHRSKKTLFYDQTTNKVSLKISEHVEDRLKISIGGEYLAFHLSADEKSDLLDNWLNWNRLVEVDQLARKEISETIE